MRTRVGVSPKSLGRPMGASRRALDRGGVSRRGWGYPLDTSLPRKHLPIGGGWPLKRRRRQRKKNMPYSDPRKQRERVKCWKVANQAKVLEQKRRWRDRRRVRKNNVNSHTHRLLSLCRPLRVVVVDCSPRQQQQQQLSERQ